MILYQDVTETVIADAILVQYSEEITAVSGLSFFSSSAVADVEAHGATMDVAATIAVSGLFFSLYSVVETHSATMDVDADVTIAANQRIYHIINASGAVALTNNNS